MKKRIVLFIALILVLLLPSCSSSSNTQMYYNGYLGISFALPENWYVDKYAEENLTDTPEGSEDYSNFEVHVDEYGNELFGVLVAYNDEPDGSLGQASVSVIAHKTNEFTTASDYAEAYYIYDLGIYEDEEYGTFEVQLTESGYTAINGIEYFVYKYEVTEHYYEETMTFGYDYYVSVLNDSFVTIEVQYYRDDPVSTDFARNFIKRVGKA